MFAYEATKKPVPKPNNMVQHMNTADYGHDLDKFWFCESETGWDRPFTGFLACGAQVPETQAA